MVTTTSDAISILIKYLASIARPISIVIYTTIKLIALWSSSPSDAWSQKEQ